MISMFADVQTKVNNIDMIHNCDKIHVCTVNSSLSVKFRRVSHHTNWVLKKINKMMGAKPFLGISFSPF